MTYFEEIYISRCTPYLPNSFLSDSFLKRFGNHRKCHGHESNSIAFKHDTNTKNIDNKETELDTSLVMADLFVLY